VELLGYERCGDGHGFEVKFPLPLYCRCEKCGTKEPATYEYKNTVYVVRDLDLWGQPSFLIFQPCFHRCWRCGHRQEHFASFKRKKVMYTYRFEEHVLRMLIGSNEEEVARRLGISAETVALIVENQLKDDKKIDPARVIKHLGFDELSLKKRHKLVRDADNRPDRPGLAEGAGRGAGPRHGGGQAVSGKIDAPAAHRRGNAPRGHGEGVRPGLQ
jgi:transposase